MNNLENNAPENEQILGQKYRGLVLAGMLIGLTNLSNPALAQTTVTRRGVDPELELVATKTVCRSKCESANRICMSAAQRAQNKSGATLQCSETVQGCKAACEKITKPGDTTEILNLPSTGAVSHKEEPQRKPEPIKPAVVEPEAAKRKIGRKMCKDRKVLRKEEPKRAATMPAKPAKTGEQPVQSQPKPEPFKFHFCPVPKKGDLIKNCPVIQPAGEPSKDETPKEKTPGDDSMIMG